MKKVLLIDNNIDTLTVLQLILSAENYEVRSFSSWPVGYSQIKTYVPDLVMMHVQLNTADGRNLAKQLKFDPGTNRIPIILYSSDISVLYNLEECGADDFIPKPFKINLVLKKVNNLIGTSKK